MKFTKKENFSPYHSEFQFLGTIKSFLVRLFQHPLRYPILFSLLTHLSLVGLFTGLKLLQFFSEEKRPKTINVSAISYEELKKMKTLGVKNGLEKNAFSLPAKSGPKSQDLNDLNLKSLGVGLNDIKEKTPKTPTANKEKPQLNGEEIAQGIGTTPIHQALESNHTEKQIIYAQTVHSMGLSSEEKQVLNAAGLDMNFSPPKGVSEEELNSEEKVYYAFQKRAYTNYINSFISEYRRMTDIKPRIKNSLMNNRHELSGKIIFDKEGNILSTKVMKWSAHDDIQELFDRTLKNLSSLPNPPESLLRNGQFTVYYQLNIN